MVGPLEEENIEIVGKAVILHAGGQIFHTQPQHLAGEYLRVFPDIAVGNAVVVDPGIGTGRIALILPIPIGDAQEILPIQPLLHFGVRSRNRFPVQAFPVFQGFQSGKAPLHRRSGFRGIGIHHGVDFKFGVEVVGLGITGSFVPAGNGFPHAVGAGGELSVNGRPVDVAVGRGSLGHALGTVAPLGLVHRGHHFPFVAHLPFQPVCLGGGQYAPAGFALAVVNIGAGVGQPVIIHPEVEAPGVKFRLLG